MHTCKSSLTRPIFNVLMRQVPTLVDETRVSPVIYFLDDFLPKGLASLSKSQENLTISNFAQTLGYPSLAQIENLTYCLTILDIKIEIS